MANNEKFYYGSKIKEKSRLNLTFQVIKSIPYFFEIFDPESVRKLLRTLNIIRYSDEKFPYMVLLSFSTGSDIVERVSFYQDPHYSQFDCIKGKPIRTYELPYIERNPRLFTMDIQSALNQETVRRVVIAGTRDHSLVVGPPKKEFLETHKPKLSVSRTLARLISARI